MSNKAFEVVPTPLLSFFDAKIILPSTDRFVVREEYVVSTDEQVPAGIKYLGDGFETFFPEIEEAAPASALHYAKLSLKSADGPIVAELGGAARAKMTLRKIFQLIKAQWFGEKSGPLLVNKSANVFYVEGGVCLPGDEETAYVDEAGRKAVLRTVGVRRYCDGWYVYPHSINSGKWSSGDRIFSLLSH